MSPDDFFAFCTSLPVAELQAIGVLSRVKHYAEDELVYSPGDESDKFFIINRGLVEIIPGPALAGGSIVLCRGDIFGETGAFTRTLRDQTARACGMLSVQCFAAKDFPELVRRVPSFVLFLCENMTRRLIQARTIEAGCELVGSLVTFDLITIYQTIVRSMRTGTLFINDERGEIVSEFYFESGTPRWGRFRHLLGEEAFWQLFVQPRKAWTFTFSRELPTSVDWAEHKTITRGADEMLVCAIQMRDEFESLRESMSDETALLNRQQLNFVWPESEVGALRPLAEEIWQIAYTKPMSLVDLCARCNACALRVYQAVAGMLRARLFALAMVEDDGASPGAKPGQPSTEEGAPPPLDASVTAAQDIPPIASTQPGRQDQLEFQCSLAAR
jgi:hypothetical protein